MSFFDFLILVALAIIAVVALGGRGLQHEVLDHMRRVEGSLRRHDDLLSSLSSTVARLAAALDAPQAHPPVAAAAAPASTAAAAAPEVAAAEPVTPPPPPPRRGAGRRADRTHSAGDRAGERCR
jgi:hypothetical protein